MTWFKGHCISMVNVLGLLAGFVGGLLLFFSITVSSSNYRLVETADHQVAICLNDKLVTSGFGGGIYTGSPPEPCPTGVGPSVAAVVKADRESFVPWGLALIAAGFIMQLPTAIREVVKTSAR